MLSMETEYKEKLAQLDTQNEKEIKKFKSGVEIN